MKTVLYILNATDLFGGATKSFMLLLRGVMQSGIKPIVITPDCNGIYSELQDMGVETIALNYRSALWTDSGTWKQKLMFVPRQLGRLVCNRLTSRKVLALFKDRDIDLIHVNCSVTNIALPLARQKHIPHIYHIREYGDLDFGFTYFPTNKSFHASLWNANIYSICITKGIQRHHGLENNPNALTIYNGITHRSTPEVLPQSAGKYFLFAGRIEPSKGLLPLLQAYSQYVHQVDSPLPLQVAGDPTSPVYAEQVHRYVADNHLEPYVHFLGQTKEMPRLYSEAKAIIISSLHEGFGRCMAEAMSYGCLVIGHNTGGTCEQFDNGLSLTGREIGLRYDTTEALVQSLLQAHNMPASQLTTILKDAFTTVNQLYTVEAYVENVLAFYSSILEKKK